MFATRSGSVRRNKLSDFVNINRNGKIAMKLDEGDSHHRRRRLHARQTRRPADHGAGGRCIRFPVGRRAGVRRPRLHRRARHPPGRGRRASSPWPSCAPSKPRRPSAPPIEARQRRAPRAGREARRGDEPAAEDEAEEADGEAVDSEPGALSPSWARRGVHPDRLRPKASASAPRPTSTGTRPRRPGLVGHDLTSAAAGWSPPSRSRTATRSCWSPTAAS